MSSIQQGNLFLQVELLGKVFSNLQDLNDLSRVQRVCKLWNSIVKKLFPSLQNEAFATRYWEAFEKCFSIPSKAALRLPGIKSQQIFGSDLKSINLLPIFNTSKFEFLYGHLLSNEVPVYFIAFPIKFTARCKPANQGLITFYSTILTVDSSFLIMKREGVEGNFKLRISPVASKNLIKKILSFQECDWLDFFTPPFEDSSDAEVIGKETVSRIKN